MKLFYYFVNPIDDMPMHFDDLDEAVAAARDYMGEEGAMAETVESVSIYRCELAQEVKGG